MSVAEILQELIIFAREHGADEPDSELRPVIRAAERRIDALEAYEERRRRLVAHKRACERCAGPSSSGILCWDCLAIAPAAVRSAFRDAHGLEGVRRATEKVRVWIRTSPLPNEAVTDAEQWPGFQRRNAA